MMCSWQNFLLIGVNANPPEYNLKCVLIHTLEARLHFKD